MKRYQVTLTKSVRVNGKRQMPDTTVEVDEKTLAELKYHAAVGHAEEIAVDGGNNDDNTPPTIDLLTELPEYKNIKGDTIKEQLAAREILFDTNDKTELYELLKTAIENEQATGADDTAKVGE